MHVGIFIPAADQPPIHLRNFQPVFVEQVRRQIKTSQWSLAPFDTVGKSLGFRRLEIFFQRAYIEVPVLAGAAAGAFLMPGDVSRHRALQYPGIFLKRLGCVAKINHVAVIQH